MARFNPDVLLIHTMLTDGVLHAVKQYREYLPGLRLVFGLDDLVGALPEKAFSTAYGAKPCPMRVHVCAPCSSILTRWWFPPSRWPMPAAT
jgi:hypothetical protein